MYYIANPWIKLPERLFWIPTLSTGVLRPDLGRTWAEAAVGPAATVRRKDADVEAAVAWGWRGRDAARDAAMVAPMAGFVGELWRFLY